MPKVSIVIPCYKSEQFIKPCFDSLVKQTFTDYDIILVDDCSPDNTVLVATRYAESFGLKTQILKNEQNIGPSLSRRRGIEISQAEYIAFCDSDDMYDEDFLMLMMAATENGSKDIVFCNYKAVYGNGKKVSHDTVSTIRGLGKKDLVARGTDSLCCTLIRRTLFGGIDFPDIRNGEDMALIPVLIDSASSFGFVNKYIYNYMYRESSLSKQITSTMLPSLKKSFEYIYEKIGQSYPDETEFLGIRNYLYGSLLNIFKESYDKHTAFKTINWFEQKYPIWTRNMYFRSLPIYKKSYLYAAKHHYFLFCRIMSVIHQAISK